jgi:thiol:disulfide interchange protein DsbD
MLDVRSAGKSFLLFAAPLFLLGLCASLSFGQPPKDPHIVQVEAYASHEHIHPGDSFQLAIVATVKPGFHINGGRPLDEFLIPTTLKFDEINDVAFSPVSYPVAEHESFSFSNDKMAVYAGKVSFFSYGRLSDDVSPGDIRISGLLNYQACNDQSCLMPRSVRFEIPLKVVETTEPVKLVNQRVFEQKASLTSNEIHAKQVIEKGLAYAIIAFFLFGLALNLTPCVYPVIPITVSFFSAQSQQKKPRIFVLASYYVVGIAIVFSVLGLISALAGKQWGFLFQNPWFVILISIIILAMAASMFGAFEFTVPSSLMTRLGQSRQGAVGSFMMGLTVGVVIAPCAAGIIIGLVGLVAKLGMVAKGTLLFFVMGLGLGLPYLFLAMCSGL